MTSNQVAYYAATLQNRAMMAQLQESIRHNQAMESFNRDQLADSHDRWISELSEKSRQFDASLFETHRSNVAKEMETNRHNVSQEALTWGSIQETKRHNLVQEASESRRLDIASDQLDLEKSKFQEVLRSTAWNETFKAQQFQWGQTVDKHRMYMDQQNLAVSWFNAQTNRSRMEHDYEIQSKQVSLSQSQLDQTVLMNAWKKYTDSAYLDIARGKAPLEIANLEATYGKTTADTEYTRSKQKETETDTKYREREYSYYPYDKAFRWFNDVIPG